MPPPSLRLRLTLIYLAGVVLTLGLVASVLRQTLRARLIDALDAELARGVAGARLAVDETGTGNPVRLSARLNTVSPVELATAPFVVAVRGPDGAVIAAAPAGLAGLLSPGPAGVRTIRTESDLRLRVLTEALPSGGTVQAAETFDLVEGPLAALRSALIVSGAITLPLITLFVWLLAGRGLAPLGDVVAFARRLRAGDLRRRLDPRGRPAEVQRLAEAFDAMLERLDAAFAQQQRFVGDISHELRTPLTALRGGLDVLQMQPDLSWELREQIDEMSAECARLVRLTQNLLALAQAEAGRLPTAAAVEMDQACLEAVHATRALRPEVTVELGGFAPVTVTGDAELLLQMVLNLMENAATLTPDGGRVTLSLGAEGDNATVRVTDTGPGIRPDDLPHVFDRFYRGNGGKRRAGGLGLGLALVQWIATAHGGTVTAANRTDGVSGAEFTVGLPLAQPIPATLPESVIAG